MQLKILTKSFTPSIFVLCLILASLCIPYSQSILWIVAIYGIARLLLEIVNQIKNKHFGLDYIAIAAICTAVYTGNLMACAIIVLMIESGRGLEKYSRYRATFDINKLIERMPNFAEVIDTKNRITKKTLDKIKIGEHILIKKGEIIALDASLIDDVAYINESSLTGEALSKAKTKGMTLYSGTINEGEAIKAKVIKVVKESTYTKIVEVVKQARDEKSELIKITSAYSLKFTILTAIICLATYFSFFDITRVLVVLVLATPCPLILATPVALISGINRAAKENIIFKNLYALEDLSKVDTLVFDKTGTLTRSKLTIHKIESLTKNFNNNDILKIAYAIELYSLHPIAKSICEYAYIKRVSIIKPDHVKEQIGKGITAKINKKQYSIKRVSDVLVKNKIVTVIYQNNKQIGKIYLSDELKSGVKDFLSDLYQSHINMFVLTGDSNDNAKAVLKNIPARYIKVLTNLNPEHKLKVIKDLKHAGHTIAMVGDGINDAPSLATAHVGIAYNSLENNITKEVSDVILFKQDLRSIKSALEISRESVKIARQSIIGGMTLSIFFMILASFGHFSPINGALIQEAIDILAILNALRANKIS